jgi:hypothetical protein
MATAMLHFLPQAPHELWQTAASPFIIPSSWQSMYQRCPKCGGSAPNVCDDVWPERWWEDDMLGLMYQGHIPPSQRISPWDAYYASSRVPSLPTVAPQPPLRIDTKYHQPQEAHHSHAPMTPPTTPSVARQVPYYIMPRPMTPTSPTLQYTRQGTWNTVSSFDSAHSVPAEIIDLSTSYP